MKIVGLITEYNPFHNGHKYHIEKALEMTGSDFAVVLMSGNFVQRGAPAIMPKHLRALAALTSGASIVMELPVCYACGSAEHFARGALSIFEALGCVDSICFGSECGDYQTLEQIAQIVAKEPPEFQKHLQNFLRKGMSFPAARQKALEEYTTNPHLSRILEKPNNILGIEYIKAILQSGSHIRPYTLKRLESGYHDTQLAQTYSSASAIRRLLAHSGNTLNLLEEHSYDASKLSELPARLEGHIPPSCIQLFDENYGIRYPIYTEDFSLLLKYKLLTEDKSSLVEYSDVSYDLANRIINHRNDFVTWEQFCDLLKTKEITFSRISRVLLHILLGIRTTDMELFSKSGFCYYARILGFSRKDAAVLREFHQKSQIPLVTKLADVTGLERAGIRMLDIDLFAADLYESVVTEKYKNSFINEYEKKLCII